MKLQIHVFAFLCLFIFSCKQEKSDILASEIKAIENGLLEQIVVEGDSLIKYNIEARMEHYHVPGVSIAVVHNGQLKWAKGYGTANTNTGMPVDVNTLFQAGSISKPLAALAALKLVEEGKADLDTDVNTYLTDWKVPENDFTQAEKVTLRRLLTHTAGTTVHGFPGYQQQDTFPSITDVLNGTGNTDPIMVDTTPGSNWRYSGGGYTIMEKMVEDVSGLPLEEYAAQVVFQPIGMENSTYEQPIGEAYRANLSAAYDGEGEIIEGEYHNYPEQAAAGLWTTPTDLARYCMEIQAIMAGKENGALARETVEQMLTKHQGDWGLGPKLTWEADSLLFGHGGKNAGFTNNMASFARIGDAIIVMTNADNGRQLIEEIFRSVSAYYDWGISEPRKVELIELDTEQLERLAGKYRLDFEIPDFGEFIFDIKVEDGTLHTIDMTDGEQIVFSPLDSLHFINLKGGQEVIFQPNAEKPGMLFNGQYQFYKLEDNKQ